MLVVLGASGCVANNFDVPDCLFEPAETTRAIDAFDEPLSGMDILPRDAFDLLATPRPAVVVGEPAGDAPWMGSGTITLVTTSDEGMLVDSGPECGMGEELRVPGELRLTLDGDSSPSVVVGLVLRIGSSTLEETLYRFDPPEVELTQAAVAEFAPGTTASDVNSFGLNYGLEPEPFVVGGLALGDAGQICFQSANVGMASSCEEIGGKAPWSLGGEG